MTHQNTPKKSMPKNLVFVRHGQSEANIINAAKKNSEEIPNLIPDENGNVEELYTIPDRSWRLTSVGAKQASLIGDWLGENLPKFDRLITSPFVRTRETAALLNLTEGRTIPAWEENRIVRERSWGEIDSMKIDEFERIYPRNALLKAKDPLYWNPPAGESIAEVGENRVRNILSTIRRENSGENVLIVTHGEFIFASEAVLQQLSDETVTELAKQKRNVVFNCTAVHYTSIDPETGENIGSLRWVRKAYPWFNREEKTWGIIVGDWTRFDRVKFTNDGLMERANEQRNRLDGINEDHLD